MPAATARLFDRFDVIRTLGQGAHATVYLARDSSTQRLVALKVVETGTADMIARLEVQGRAQALDHPNIIGVVAPMLTSSHPVFGASKSMVGIALEYVEGEALDRLLRRLGGTLNLREALQIGLDVTNAVAHAHSLDPPVVHRDLKPGNIIVNADGVAFLTDFGHALLLEKKTRLTRSRVALGTRQYAAPELMANAKYATPAADVYGIGALLFHLLTGKYAHDAERELGSTVVRASALTPGVPRSVDELIEGCLAYEPQDRPLDAHSLARALHEELALAD